MLQSADPVLLYRGLQSAQDVIKALQTPAQTDEQLCDDLLHRLRIGQWAFPSLPFGSLPVISLTVLFLR